MWTFLGLTIYHTKPHMVHVVPALFDTVGNLTSLGSTAPFHIMRSGESMVRTSYLRTYTHHLYDVK